MTSHPAERAVTLRQFERAVDRVGEGVPELLGQAVGRGDRLRFPLALDLPNGARHVALVDLAELIVQPANRGVLLVNPARERGEELAAVRARVEGQILFVERAGVALTSGGRDGGPLHWRRSACRWTRPR
jgi:hypothetical protein